MEAAFDKAQSGQCKLISSWLSVAEVCFAAHEKIGKKLDDSVDEKLKHLWHPASPLHLIEVHETLVRDAHMLIRKHIEHGWAATRGADAVHLVTAHRESVDQFWCTEHNMNKWAEVLGFEVCEPHDLDSPEAANLFRNSTK